MLLKSGVLATWLECGELGSRISGVEHGVGRGWELLFSGSGSAGVRAGRRLTLASLSSVSMWLNKGGDSGRRDVL